MGKAGEAAHPRRGEIHVVDFDPAIGAEIRKKRPALIVQSGVWNRMKKRNLTLAIEEEVLLRARVVAATRRRLLTDLVRGFLESLAREYREREASLRRLRQGMREQPLVVGRWRWKRDDLHVRWVVPRHGRPRLRLRPRGSQAPPHRDEAPPG
ncbi:MAG: type II toxin-antitoxin system PemK/MazF family toxin [Planctomycetes bacterium]|nr:type II toxin-antitoxin system PemK/MazF family toxin [Planctomycetota bacterium]